MNYFDITEIADTPLEKIIHIPDKPTGMYIQGNPYVLSNKKLITVVGSRVCSSYAKEVVLKLVRDLAPFPVCIISGLALGIDRIAHTAALENNVPTIAFPGSGLNPDVIYPASHQRLAQEILESDGLLISEYPPHTKAARWTFPKRNRLMAGVADLVIIIEAKEKSGTLITARLAMEYGTTVAVIPQNITASHAYGSNRLMQDGAYPILSYKDILSLLSIQEEVAEPAPKIYTPLEEKILSHLSEPTPKDELCLLSGLSYQEFITTLSCLELSGSIYEKYGKVHKA